MRYRTHDGEERVAPEGEWPEGLGPLRGFEYLEAIRDHGTISGAAQHLKVTQPAVSAMIKRLEGSLGLDLLERRGSYGTTLTPEGHVVLDHYLHLARVARAAWQGMRAVRAMPDPEPADERVLRIAASTTTSELLVPRWLELLERELQRSAGTPDTPSGLRVSSVSTRSAQVIDEVLLGRCDVGFIADDNKQLDHRLVVKNVGEDEIVVVVPVHHSWARDGRATLDELLSVPQVARQEGSGALDVFRRALREAQQSQGMAPTEIPIVGRYNSSTALLQAVLEQWHPAAVSSLAVADKIASGELRQVVVPEVVPKTRLRRAIWREDPPPSDLVKELVKIAENDTAWAPRRDAQDGAGTGHTGA